MRHICRPLFSVLLISAAAACASRNAPAQTWNSPTSGQSQSFRRTSSHTLPPFDLSPYCFPNAAEPSSRQASPTANAVVIEQPQEPAWNKGKFRIVPYGAFWADVTYATDRTSPGAYTLFVFSEEDQGEDALEIDARRTRLGLDIAGPSIMGLAGARTGGKVEIDFHGNFITENRASVLLRQGYWELKNDDFRVLIGQTSDVISPLLPRTLNYGFGYLGGNVGYRRTQLRAERFVSFSSDSQLILQGSLNQDIVTDFPTDTGIRREASNWPVVQARAAFTLGPRGDGDDPLTFGISGHIGETGFDFLSVGPPPLSLPPEDDARFRTWSFNVDVHVPLTDRCGVQGEYFTGANLSAFLGGIGQGVCPCMRVPIRSSGGWMNVWYDWTSTTHSHAGLGLDNPNDNDSLLGRSRNHFIFANILLDVTEHLSTGLEVTWWETLYHEERAGQIPDDQLSPSDPGRAVTIDWMIKYEF